MIKKKNIAYTLSAIAIVGLAFLGSKNKIQTSSSNLNIGNLVDNSFNLSTDQLSEFYIVANTANSFNLASTDVVSSNYVVVSVLQKTGQSSGGGTIEKPNIVDTSNISRGVITHVVEEGDTMDALAARLKITTDQIRWSNGLISTTITPGQVLYLPNTSGIVYTVKSGETLNSIVKTYGSSVDLIIAQNNLSSPTVNAGDKIVLPNGSLPVTLRPEYVPPKRTVVSYSYSGSTSERKNLTVIKKWSYRESLMGDGNPGAPGQCTWYAWYWRRYNSKSLGQLPGGLSHAKTWASTLSRKGYRVDHTPEVGAVFQTTGGTYGHVGVVTAINADGSIVVREMNYGHVTYRETEATVPANIVKNFNYIH